MFINWGYELEREINNFIIIFAFDKAPVHVGRIFQGAVQEGICTRAGGWDQDRWRAGRLDEGRGPKARSKGKRLAFKEAIEWSGSRLTFQMVGAERVMDGPIANGAGGSAREMGAGQHLQSRGSGQVDKS